MTIKTRHPRASQMHGQPVDAVGFIDCTPTWAAILPVILLAHREGSEEGRRVAAEELARMAQAADKWNAYVKEQAK